MDAHADGHTPAMADTPVDEATKLREEQAHIARRERGAAEDAPDAEAEATHDRRAEKAAYLAAKLAERERSEADD